jgi:transcriptional regulator with XRE-family HTH domain
MIDIETLKTIKKQKKMTLQDIADRSGIPKRTLEDIFRGYTRHPRLDTLQAIERALGLTQEQDPAPEYTEEERKLFALIEQLTDDEVAELSNFVDFILSKRK